MQATIICPSYNSKKVIGRALQSWAEQDYPRDKYEILIVDNFSTDGTKDIVEEFARKYPNIKYVSDRS